MDCFNKIIDSLHGIVDSLHGMDGLLCEICLDLFMDANIHLPFCFQNDRQASLWMLQNLREQVRIN